MTAEPDLLPLPSGNVAHLIAAQASEIEALRAEVERVSSWNARVSVCRDHVADIVDGLCVICALDAAEARADKLRAEVGETKEVAVRAMRQRDAQYNRAERLAEALRGMMAEYESLHAEHDLGECQATVDARAALRDQEEGQ